MNKEEILNMKMLIGHLDLTTDTKNKLYNQTTKIEDILNKQKEVLDKIKEYMNKNENNPVYLDMKLYETEVYNDILEILEEIE